MVFQFFLTADFRYYFAQVISKKDTKWFLIRTRSIPMTNILIWFPCDYDQMNLISTFELWSSICTRHDAMMWTSVWQWCWLNVWVKISAQLFLNWWLVDKCFWITLIALFGSDISCHHIIIVTLSSSLSQSTNFYILDKLIKLNPTILYGHELTQGSQIDENFDQECVIIARL